MLQLSQFLCLYRWVWKPDLMNFLLWSWPEVLNFTLWKLGHFSLAWSELCVFQNITKKAKETSLYNPGSGKILEKRHRDLKTELIFMTDLRIPAVTHKSATKSGTVITSFILVQSLRAGYLWYGGVSGSFFLTVLKWMTHRKSWWSCYNC